MTPPNVIVCPFVNPVPVTAALRVTCVTELTEAIVVFAGILVPVALAPALRFLVLTKVTTVPPAARSAVVLTAPPL